MLKRTLMAMLLACSVQAGCGCGAGETVDLTNTTISTEAVGPTVAETNDWKIEDFSYDYRTHSLWGANCKTSGKAVVGTPVKAVVNICGG